MREIIENVKVAEEASFFSKRSTEATYPKLSPREKTPMMPLGLVPIFYQFFSSDPFFLRHHRLHFQSYNMRIQYSPTSDRITLSNVPFFFSHFLQHASFLVLRILFVELRKLKKR